MDEFAEGLQFGELSRVGGVGGLLANDSKFGLVNYVWSNDLNTVMRCSRDIRAGTVWANTPMMRELRAAFGGYKESGIGRDGPYASLEFFTELKATIIPIDPVSMHRYGA